MARDIRGPWRSAVRNGDVFVATLAIIAVALLSLFVAVLFGALLELYRDVRQLRDVAGILDRPLNVDIGPLIGHAPSEYGLPRALDSNAASLLLFLSERCLTCRIIASSFQSALPSGLWIVAEARDADAAQTFMELTKLVTDDRVTMDVGGAIAARMGINTSPVGFRIEFGRFVSATTIPSTRYLQSVLPAPLHVSPLSAASERTASNGKAKGLSVLSRR
jgi:hypothetical protein